MTRNGATKERGKPSHSGDDLESLYRELLRRYYDEGDRKQAEQVARQLETALATTPGYGHSIRGEEVRSVIAELRDDLAAAIQSREAEIRKILELHARTSNTPHWDYVARQYGYSDVSDRLDLLAILYDKQGEQDRALAVLLESKSYCESHRIPFDGQELLDELERARKDDSERGTEGVPLEVIDDAIRRAFGRFSVPTIDILAVEEKSRRFTAAVNQLLPRGIRIAAQDVKRRLLTLSRRGAARGGLPRL